MTNGQIIQLLFLLLIISSLLMALLVNKARKQLQEKKENSLFLPEKRMNGKSLGKLYDVMIQWPVTRQFTKKLTEQYKIIFPEDLHEIKKQTTKTILLIAILDTVLFFLLFVLRPSLIQAITTITWIYIANNQSLYLLLEKYEIKLDTQSTENFDMVNNHYQEHGMIDDAVYQALETSAHPISLHMQKIHEVLISEIPEEEVQEYHDIAPNRFLKIFTSLCVLIMKFGDRKIGKKTVFLMNLGNLKRELQMEINRKKSARWLFSGLTFIIIMPINFLEEIKKWAIGCFSNLAEYYNGAFGIAIVVMIFVFTIGGFQLINKLKDTGKIEKKNYLILDWLSTHKPFRYTIDNMIEKNYGRMNKLRILLKCSGEVITVRQFLVKKILYGILTFLACLVILFSIHVQKRDNYLHNVESVNNYSSMMSQTQEEEMKDLIVKFVSMYKHSNITQEDIADKLIREGAIKSKALATLTAQEVVKRVKLYQNEYFRWYELVFSILFSILAYHSPYIVLRVMKKAREKVMEDEVIKFYSIISMLKYIDRMTVQTVLEWMETFAVVFKESIQKCLNDLQEGDMEALEQLKRDEPFKPFIRLIDSIQMCDKLPMEMAFDQIEADREAYQENRKLENEIFTKDKSEIATIIAWIPLAITIGFYLIIPWIVEGLNNFFIQMDQMKSLYR